MNVTNSTVLITGAASGIGLALAKAYLNHHAYVIICGRDEEKLEKIQKELPDIKTITCDISHDDDVDKLIQNIEKNHPSIDVLINNAGIQENYSLIDKKDHSSKIFNEININLISHLKLVDRFLPKLLSRDHSAIINVSSALAFVPKKSAPIYCASKAAIHIYTKVLRYQLEDNSVKVFEIIPPLVDTKMTQGRGTGKISPETLAQEALKNIESDHYEIHIGKSKILLFLHRFLPFLAEKIIKNG